MYKKINMYIKKHEKVNKLWQDFAFSLDNNAVGVSQKATVKLA